MKNFLNQSLIAALLVSGAMFTTQASVVQVKYVNPPTGVSDGADFVLPYAITIDGTATSAICYDNFDTIIEGQTWFANEFTLSDAVSSGFFPAASDTYSKYEEVAWLSLQSYTNAADQIDLQHNIWNVFGEASTGQPYTVQQGADSYSAALATAEADGYAGVDFSRVAFLQPVNSVAGSAPGQAFVIDPPASNAPEPATAAMLGSGLLLIGICTRKRALKFASV
jgi:hypothetical protein